MVNFAELRAKAEKAKDAGVTKAANTRDRYSSASSKNMTWDPNWKAGQVRSPPPASSRPSGKPPMPPPPVRTRPPEDGPAPSPGPRPGMGGGASGGAPPPINRSSRPDAAPLPPPPSRTSGFVRSPQSSASPPAPASASAPPPPVIRVQTHSGSPEPAEAEIDWANLSPEDKEAFFDWLDEFFSRYLGVTLEPRRSKSGSGLGRGNVNALASRLGSMAFEGGPPGYLPRPQPAVNAGSRPT